MFRNRIRPSTPHVDNSTAEHLLRAAPVGDLPDPYRPLARLLADASGPATPEEYEGSAAAAAAFVAAHHAVNTPRRRQRSMAASVFVAISLAAMTGTAVAATQGALPDPAQQAAHEALKVVGISVPGIGQRNEQTGPHGSSNSGSTTGGNSGGNAGTPTATPAHPDASGTAGTTVGAGGV
jgi:hypothetical protein